MYIPRCSPGQESRHCKLFSELLVVTMIIIIIIIVVCAQVYPMYAPETLPPHHSWLRRLREHCLLCPSRLSDYSRGKHPIQRVAAVYSQVWWCYMLVQNRSTSELWLFLNYGWSQMQHHGSWDSRVSIETRPWAVQLRIWQWQEILLFSEPSRLSLWLWQLFLGHSFEGPRGRVAKL